MKIHREKIKSNFTDGIFFFLNQTGTKQQWCHTPESVQNIETDHPKVSEQCQVYLSVCGWLLFIQRTTGVTIEV